LPKEFLYARIPPPPDGTLTLEPTQQPAAQQPAATRKIPLHPAAVNIVLVKTIAQNVPPLITHFTLPPTRQILN
ncbi:MAG: hypothetical protein LBR12_03830, partial [Opitutaceae bacterium]|nr:hypothetical protein [Opitutaceae bacterium]